MFEFLRTGLVPRLPTAVLATSCVLLSPLSLSAGLILEAVAQGRKEIKRLSYLAIPVFEHDGVYTPTTLMLTPDAAAALAKAVIPGPAHALPPALMPME